MGAALNNPSGDACEPLFGGGIRRRGRTRDPFGTRARKPRAGKNDSEVVACLLNSRLKTQNLVLHTLSAGSGAGALLRLPFFFAPLSGPRQRHEQSIAIFDIASDDRQQSIDPGRHGGNKSLVVIFRRPIGVLPSRNRQIDDVTDLVVSQPISARASDALRDLAVETVEQISVEHCSAHNSRRLAEIVYAKIEGERVMLAVFPLQNDPLQTVLPAGEILKNDQDVVICIIHINIRIPSIAFRTILLQSLMSCLTVLYRQNVQIPRKPFGIVLQPLQDLVSEFDYTFSHRHFSPSVFLTAFRYAPCRARTGYAVGPDDFYYNAVLPHMQARRSAKPGLFPPPGTKKAPPTGIRGACKIRGAAV